MHESQKFLEIVPVVKTDVNGTVSSEPNLGNTNSNVAGLFKSKPNLMRVLLVFDDGKCKSYQVDRSLFNSKYAPAPTEIEKEIAKAATEMSTKTFKSCGHLSTFDCWYESSFPLVKKGSPKIKKKVVPQTPQDVEVEQKPHVHTKACPIVMPENKMWCDDSLNPLWGGDTYCDDCDELVCVCDEDE